jgi:hypothetical protein
VACCIFRAVKSTYNQHFYQSALFNPIALTSGDRHSHVPVKLCLPSEYSTFTVAMNEMPQASTGFSFPYSTLPAGINCSNCENCPQNVELFKCCQEVMGKI